MNLDGANEPSSPDYTALCNDGDRHRLVHSHPNFFPKKDFVCIIVIIDWVYVSIEF